MSSPQRKPAQGKIPQECTVEAVALLVENYHELRHNGQTPSLILLMPEAKDPYVVVRFGGPLAASAVTHFADARTAARSYLNL